MSPPTDLNAQRPVSPTDTLQLTLADARLRGLRDNTDLIAIRLDTAIARGELRQSGTLLFNPAFDVVAPVAGNNAEFGVSQELEIFGQRGKRVAAGQASFNRARAGTENSARLIVGEIDRTFYQLVSASERTRLAEEVLELNTRLASVAERQLAAGEISRLDYNLAVVELGRSRSRMLATRREREQVEYELQRLLGLRGNAHLVPNIGNMQDEGIPDSTATGRTAHDHAARAARLNSDSLVTLALTQRRDLTERSAATEQAAAEAALARREALPNLLLRGVLQRGPNGNQSIAPGIGLTLPIFNRNRGLAHARDAVAKQSELVFASLLVRVRTE
ncbi:MAG: TolC family protein, partial [Gemmatimonas sp.]